MPTLTPAELNKLLAALPDPTAANEPFSSLSFLQLFASLGREQLDRLITEQTCLPGEVLFWEDEPGEAMYVIRSGLTVALKGQLDAPTFLGYRGAGEVMGEMALLDDEPRSATGLVIKESRLMRFGREEFRQMTRLSPEIGVNIMREISRRLRVADDARHHGVVNTRELVSQVSLLQSEKQQLLELQRVRQETSDLIVHDLRNPLQNILSALHLLPIVLPPEVWDENREMLEIAHASCDRMRLLIDNLLEVARMESGEVTLELDTVSLPALVEGVVQRMKEFTNSGAKLQISCPESLPSVQADPQLLDRVLTNLIDNAVKHTPSGGRVVVAAERQSEEMVTVSVTDTGPGIPPAEWGRVFERFAQLSSETRQRNGFGLGLTFCRLAVLAHGGRIWVEAGEGGLGSRFVFTLPLSAN